MQHLPRRARVGFHVAERGGAQAAQAANTDTGGQSGGSSRPQEQRAWQTQTADGCAERTEEPDRAQDSLADKFFTECATPREARRTAPVLLAARLRSDAPRPNRRRGSRPGQRCPGRHRPHGARHLRASPRPTPRRASARDLGARRVGEAPPENVRDRRHPLLELRWPPVLADRHHRGGDGDEDPRPAPPLSRTQPCRELEAQTRTSSRPGWEAPPSSEPEPARGQTPRRRNGRPRTR